jgi:signal transduction histidine kinase
MNVTGTKKLSVLPREKQLFILFVVVAIIAVTGFILIPFQEKKRVRIIAEYQAYQFATLLLQDVQNSVSVDYDKMQDLKGFGIYSIDGTALFKTSKAPQTVSVQDLNTAETVRFMQNRIQLILPIGGAMALRESHMRGMDFLNRGRSAGPMLGRYLYIEYAAPALAQGLTAIAVIGPLGALALILAFILIFTMFRRLEAYRAKEARNRQLLALEEASRTLADEIKNPLAVIITRCALLKKKGLAEEGRDVTVIEEETYRIVHLVDKIRSVLISDETVKQKESV